MWYHIWDDRPLSGVSVIKISVCGEFLKYSLDFLYRRAHPIWGQTDMQKKNIVPLFSINKMYVLYIFLEFSIGPVVC